MVYKTAEERIGNLEEKIKKLESQKKTLEARTREKQRKARTRRLIQIGAIIESMGIDSEEKAKSFKDYFINNPKSKNWLEEFLVDNEENNKHQ